MNCADGVRRRYRHHHCLSWVGVWEDKRRGSSLFKLAGCCLELSPYDHAFVIKLTLACCCLELSLYDHAFVIKLTSVLIIVSSNQPRKCMPVSRGAYLLTLRAMCCIESFALETIRSAPLIEYMLPRLAPGSFSLCTPRMWCLPAS